MNGSNRTGIWAVVLAGGEGERLRAFTTQWLGRHVPKQYCTFVGTRSMLEHTLDRAARLCTPERVVTVIARSHDPFLTMAHPALKRGVVVRQPVNRDTAAGVFLALSYVRAADPDASVIVLPSDHFVDPDDLFLEMLAHGAQAAQSLDRLILFGAQPQTPELEYGWLRAGGAIGSAGGRPIRMVEAFVEKPAPQHVPALHSGGALWSTMVMAGPLTRFWSLGRRQVAEVVSLFELLVDAIGAPGEAAVLDDIYRRMPARNFSAHFLQQLTDALAVIELRDVVWSDWGNPARIVETLRRLGRKPAFARVTAARPGRQKPLPAIA